ncbi:MAG: hypothetical protein Q8S18_04820 [Bacteroidales bacterium]|nr:hypothetical protein [Bacteroidales bacterium]
MNIRYSKEKVYKDFGQYDKVVTLSFYSGSKSFDEFPEYMTGIFQYSHKERKEMEELIQQNESTFGFIRFKELLNKINDEKKEYLIKQGLNCEEISSIFTLAEFNQTNEFKSINTRKLAEPYIIECDFGDDFDCDSLLLNLNDSKRSGGYKLTPDETAEDIGTRLNYEDIEFGGLREELKVPIRKYYLKCRARNYKATEEEIYELQTLESEEIVNKISFLNEEIKRAGITKKYFIKIKPQIEELAPFLLKFNEKRLTHGKFVVWLNFERYIHIFLGHVNEANLGRKFESKTKFQYLVDEILRLIEIVIESLEEEIQKHFTETSGKNFKRHGEMAVYYKGDYYVVDINPDGLLMTFYKRD